MNTVEPLPTIKIKREKHPDVEVMPSHFDEELAILGVRVDIPIGEAVQIEFRSIPIVAHAKVILHDEGVCYMRLIKTVFG